MTDDKTKRTPSSAESRIAGHAAVQLRPYEPADQPAMAALFMDRAVMRYVGDGSPIDASEVPTVVDKVLRLYKSDPSFFIWAIQEGDEYAGHSELKRRKGRSEYELIYLLQQTRWGRSLGGEVVDLLLSEARKRHIPFVIATVHPNNAPSIAILSRRGFTLDGALSAELDCRAYGLDLDIDDVH